MFTRNDIMTVVNGLYGELTKSFEDYKAARSEELTKAIKGDFDTACTAIQTLKRGVESVVKATAYAGAYVNEFYSSVNTYKDGDKNYVDLTIKSKLKAKTPFKSKVKIFFGDDTVAEFCKAYIDAAIQLLYIEYAEFNVNELNDILAQAGQDAGIKYSMATAISDNFIADISDDKIVYGVSIDEALNFTDNAMLKSGGEYTEYCASLKRDEFVEALKTIQTPAQAIRANLPLIASITGGKTFKRADKLLRKTFHKQAKFLNTVKEGIGYFCETVDETIIFALVEKTADGELKLVLSPFDVATGFAVDYDVISAVKASF